MFKNKTIWMFNEIGKEFKETKEGDTVEIQIMRTGKWSHPLYGMVNVDEGTLDDVVKNYNENQRGIDLAIDENHEPNHKALGWIKGLARKSKQALFATIELTKMGADLINQGAYKYFSPEIVFEKKDEETGKVIKNLLIGGAFTNRPFFKAMKPLMASEEYSGSEEDINKTTLFFNTNVGMNKILELLAKFTEGGLSAEDKASLKQLFSEMDADDKTPELTAAIKEATAEITEKKEEFSEKKVEDKKEEKSENKKEEKKFTGEEVTVSASEFNEMKAQNDLAVKIIAERKKEQVQSKINGFAFSESNSKGVILPKAVEKVVEFAMGLSDNQVEKFYEIIGGMQVISTGELGHDGNAEQKYSEDHMNFYMEKFKMSKEDAIEAAKEAAKM